jgi:hypothetical protein
MKTVLVIAVSSLLCASLAYSDVISVNGSNLGSSSIDGIAEGWSISFDDIVSVSVHLDNGSGGAPAIGNTAYLTSGPLPNLADIVATTNFTLPGTFNGPFTVFSNLSLDEGSYWLIFSSAGPPDSYASWQFLSRVTTTTAPGVQYLGFALSGDGGTTFAPPVVNTTAGAFQLTVTDVPEPPSLMPYLVGLAAFGVFLRGRSVVNTLALGAE